MQNSEWGNCYLIRNVKVYGWLYLIVQPSAVWHLPFQRELDNPSSSPRKKVSIPSPAYSSDSYSCLFEQQYSMSMRFFLFVFLFV